MEDCKHYFDWGAVGSDPVVYCTKCDKELYDLGIPETILTNHKVENGKLVHVNPNRTYITSIWNLISAWYRIKGRKYESYLIVYTED